MAYFVAIAGTNNLTGSANNPVVALSKNFMDGNFGPTGQILVSPFIGSLLALILFSATSGSSLAQEAKPEQVIFKDEAEQLEAQDVLKEDRDFIKNLIESDKDEKIIRED